MNNANTLIILAPGFAANEKDSTCLPGQQVFVKALNKNFPSLRITILAFQYPPFKKAYKWFGNDIISFNGGNKGKFSRLLLWWHVYRALIKLNRQNNIAGVLSFWVTECAFIGKFFSKKHHLKHISWILGQDAKKGNVYVRWIKPASDELIALSDFISDTFLKNYAVKPAHIIPPGIDVSMFSKKEPEKKIDIMGAGSLIPLKQYNVFVEVVAAIKKSFPLLNAVLCGAGPEDQKLKEMSNQYDLEKNLLLTGKKEHIEVLQLMQQSKIFMHTSSYEGFGIVCLEALFAGAHVISFIKPMDNSIQNWHIVNSKEEMVEKVLVLLKNETTQYEQILFHSADDTAKDVMRLFSYDE